MPKFSLEKTANATQETVFGILSDYENYQKLLPGHFPSVRVRSVRENVAVVEEHMNLGAMELVIMAKHVTKEPVLHDIFVIGGDAKGSHIRQQFLKVPEGTKIIVDVDLKLKVRMKMSNLFGKNNLKEGYAKVLNDFVKVSEI